MPTNDTSVPTTLGVITGAVPSLETTSYGTFALLALPAASVAVNENVFAPIDAVSIGLPEATEPVQAATPEVASVQP